MRKFFSVSVILGPMLIGLLVPPSTLIWIGDGITRGGGTLASIVGLYPPDVIRLLIILMAIHYAMELPGTFRRGKAVWESSISGLRKWLGSFNVMGHFAMKVAVPVLFCLVVEGSPHFGSATPHLAL